MAVETTSLQTQHQTRLQNLIGELRAIEAEEEGRKVLSSVETLKTFTDPSAG